MRAADLGYLLALAALLVVPSLFGSFTAYQLSLFLIYGIVGQGIALCWGRTGFLPLGQAMFFGIGAYVTGGGLIAANDSWLVIIPAVLLAGVLPAILAGVIGLLVFRRQSGSGPFFSVVTLAFSMLAYQIAISRSDITGGFNGLNGIPSFPGTDPWDNLYWVILAAVVASSALLIWLLRSPLGLVWSAIDQNETRLNFLGYDTALLKAIAFAISAALAGLAGALFAAQQGIVTPEAVGYVLSGELLIWTAVGGRSSVLGPLAGAIIVGFLSTELRDRFASWEMGLAVLFIVIVLYFPGGLAGGVARLFRGTPSSAVRDRTIERPLPALPGQPDLRFESIDVAVGQIQILSRLSIAIEKAGLHCLIGPNGAGKTSAFNTLTGKFAPRSGNIVWGGKQIAGKLPHQVARLGIGRKLQVPSIFPDLTIGEHLAIALWSTSFGVRTALSMTSFRWQNAVLKEMCALFPFLRNEHQRAGDLSLGHRQMLELALAVLARPSLVLLDEPCAGLSTEETAQMIKAIAQIRAKFDVSALIIEHDFSVVEALSDRVLVMHQGQLLAEGSLADIRANDAVQNVYAGGVK